MFIKKYIFTTALGLFLLAGAAQAQETDTIIKPTEEPTIEIIEEIEDEDPDLTGSKLSGDIQTQANFFIRDSSIGAANTPQYDRQKFGSTTWVTLNYRNWGFDIGLRFDAFNNSNLVDPLDSYTAVGIGRWHLAKSVGKLDVKVGYIYDQIGTGTIFRAYENRALAIDNALVGARFQYQFTPNFYVKMFGGKQKKVEKQPNLSETYAPIIAGGAAENFAQISDNISMVTGAAVVRRTLDDATMNVLVQDISSYVPEDKFIPKYTTYVFGAYNTLSINNFTWYAEGAYKTHEAINSLRTDGVLEDRAGYTALTSLAYSQKGFALQGAYKRTDHFAFRTSPLQILNRGQIAFLAPMARQNTYRLSSRYNAATQEIGEQAVQFEAMYSYKRKLQFLFNFSNITKLDNSPLYREFYFEASYKKGSKWKTIAGFQMQQYNQEVYEFKPNAPIVRTYIPFAEFNYSIDDTKSFRIEAQYMHCGQDYGSWLYGLFEFNIAPKWSFSITDMINVVPKKYDRVKHFYTALVSYTEGSMMFAASYVKQVEGIVCTGGVCRYEPAFNGVRLNIQARF